VIAEGEVATDIQPDLEDNGPPSTSVLRSGLVWSFDLILVGPGPHRS